MNKDLDTYLENAKAQLRKGILEFSVLLSIAASELYATDILNKLKEFDLIVVEGTLYPILSRLKEAEMVSYTWAESKEGPPRKYYKLTDKGKEILKQLTINYETLNKSINQLIKQS
ncbi:MAG: PadR family transcriptional regulator [Candidatus Doudnabacteria bacterium]|nr:PadR family transcriptional regulator [Candidatus Doudnabacteria bacterium]